MMNDRHRLRHPVATRATRLAAGSLLALAALGAATGSTVAAPAGSGAIWTTNAPCTAPALQNRNQYVTGDTVYVRGEGFDATATFDWTITGQPGGASGDPRATVAGGTAATDDGGSFCVAAYVIVADDWGEYTVDVTQDRSRKNDNYQVTGTGLTDGGTTDGGSTDGTTDGGPTGGTDSGTTGGSTDSGSTGGTDSGTTSGSTDGGTTGGSTDAGSTGGTDSPTGTTEGGSTGGSDSGTGTGTTDGASNGPASDDSTAGDPSPTQSVLGAVGSGPGAVLPETDTITGPVTDGPSIVVILGAAGLAGLAVLLAPRSRREPDAIE